MLDPKRLEDFAARLRRHPRVKVPQAVVWKHFAAAFPSRPPGEERAWLVQALEALEARGLVELPSRQGLLWDKALHPPTPKSIRVKARSKPPQVKMWRTYAWHPALAWVVDMPALPTEHETFLRKLNDALIQGTLRDRAPLKYRSLQLCKHEKALAALRGTSLFGEGKLSWDMLNVEAEVLPLAWHPIRPAGGRVLILENAATFHVARTVLEQVGAEAPYDILAFGGGNGILQSIPYLGTIGRPIRSIRYCGDLDREGIHIAQGAAAAAEAAGLPYAEPATNLHSLMLSQREKFDHPDGWKDEAKERSLTMNLSALTWLDPSVRDVVGTMLRRGRRVPEEVLGPQELEMLWRSAPNHPHL